MNPSAVDLRNMPIGMWSNHPLIGVPNDRCSTPSSFRCAAAARPYGPAPMITAPISCLDGIKETIRGPMGAILRPPRPRHSTVWDRRAQATFAGSLLGQVDARRALRPRRNGSPKSRPVSRRPDAACDHPRSAARVNLCGARVREDRRSVPPRSVRGRNARSSCHRF